MATINESLRDESIAHSVWLTSLQKLMRLQKAP